MAVLINFKICDNAPECGGVAACPKGALYWDDVAKQVSIDNSKCVSCRKCEGTCGVEAIKVAKTEEEYEKFKKEIEADPRKREDLLVDRYGAQPILDAYQLKAEALEAEISKPELRVVEFYNQDSIMCLLKSIPIKELFAEITDNYKKVEIKDASLLEKFDVTKLPVLLFFRNGALLGKVEGYYGNEQKEELAQLIKQVSI